MQWNLNTDDDCASLEWAGGAQTWTTFYVVVERDAQQLHSKVYPSAGALSVIPVKGESR